MAMQKRPIAGKMYRNNAYKNYQKAYDNAFNKLDQEIEEQTELIYSAAAIALATYWDWGAVRINRLFHYSQDAVDECAMQGNSVSLVQMFDKECNIDLVEEITGKDWRELDYLNPDANKYNWETMTPPQKIYMRQRQAKWIRPTMLAAMGLGLHRKEGFGFERLSRLFNQINEVSFEYNWDRKALLEAAKEVAHINITKSKEELFIMMDEDIEKLKEQQNSEN